MSMPNRTLRYADLQCPTCGSNVECSRTEALCQHPECGVRYPIIDGIPVLINERCSTFSTRDFSERKDTYFRPPSRLRSLAVSILPTISGGGNGRERLRQFSELLRAGSAKPSVLVIGGSIVGVGMEDLVNEGDIELIETDVSFGPRTMLICDAHDIPFKTGKFDGVIAQAVLEHVADPYRCVEEIFRVLKPNGIVYAETPFMQQVHGKCYDFTRFTDRGHRRLFRRFRELRSGICGGPGTALAWSCQYFLLSFTANKVARAFVRMSVKLSLFWLKYFDYFLQNKPGALDAASAFFFFGQKSDSVISDREVCEQYRGANSVDL